MIAWAHPSPKPKRHLDRFSRFYTDDRRVSLYFTIGRPSPSKLPFPWGIWTPCMVPGPSRVLNPNGISIGWAVFARPVNIIVWQTDHATRSIGLTIGRICVRSNTANYAWDNVFRLSFTPSIKYYAYSHSQTSLQPFTDWSLCWYVVDGAWCEWSKWSDCYSEVTSRKRSRRCECPPPANAGQNCQGTYCCYLLS